MLPRTNTNTSIPWLILGSRRFLPLFLTQFLGALNDNVFKAALLIYLSHRSVEHLDTDGGQMVTIAAGLFILPFLLFSAWAGQLADSHERSAMTRLIKMWEIVLMLVAAVCFFLPPSLISLGLLMLLIFFMGAQSTFFGPIKYSLIPEHLHKHEVVSANALVGSSTFVAILVGTIGGSILAAIESSYWLCSTLIVLALSGWIASRFIPAAPIASPNDTINLNIVKQVGKLLKRNRSNRFVWRCILGISWFWTIGAIFLTQLPHYCAAQLGLDASSVSVFLAVLLLGIGLGALLYPIVSRGRNMTAWTKPSLVTMACAIAVFAGLSLLWPTADCAPTCSAGIEKLFESPILATALMAALLTTAIAGGIFIVPLYVSVQFHSNRQHLSSTIATNNILNSLFMVLSSVVCIVLYLLGASVVGIFALTAVFALAYLFINPGTEPQEQSTMQTENQ